MEDPELLEAYLSYYWPVSYAQVSRVMHLCGLRPLRVLDLGSGPGPMAAAAFDRGATELCLVDHSGAALKLAQRLMVDPQRYAGGASAGSASVPKDRTSFPNSINSPQTTKQPAIQCIQVDLESPEAIQAGPFDLVILGHCLNELGADEPDRRVRVERRATLVQRAASALAPGGSVMVVDPATLASARDGMALRDRLAGLGWRVTGPCTRQEPCPALAAGENQSCHDEASWTMPEAVRRLAEGAGLDRERIKMFWLVLQPPGRVLEGDRAGSGSVAGNGDRAASGGDRAATEAQTYRVVSEPMLNKAGRIRYLLCGQRGRFPFSARKDDRAAAAAGFFSLSRYDSIRVDEPESREGGGWGFGPATRISVLLPPGARAGTIDL